LADDQTKEVGFIVSGSWNDPDEMALPLQEQQVRSRFTIPNRGAIDDFLTAYQLLQRPVGPSPLSEVVFASALINKASSFSEMGVKIVQFAQDNDGVALSGSRLHRGPQNIFVPNKFLRGV
jgi:hypothetical protein